MEILGKVAEEDCAQQHSQDCHNIHPYGFAAALRDLTEHGQGKFRNIMIISPVNCGKTFLLAPLQIIFKTFNNPANNKYA